MYLKQLAALGASAVMVLTGGAVASGAETKTSAVDAVTPYEYTAAVETLAASGVVAGSSTALQPATGCVWHRNPVCWKAMIPCP